MTGRSLLAWPGVPIALASAALFGASTPFVKLLLGGGLDPWLLAGLLYLGAGLGLGLMALARGGGIEAPLRRRDLPRLALIQSLWAGVDRLLDDPTLPAGVPVARMVDPAMTAAMVETALWATLALHRGFFAYARAQAEGRWAQQVQRRHIASGLNR